MAGASRQRGGARAVWRTALFVSALFDDATAVTASCNWPCADGRQLTHTQIDRQTDTHTHRHTYTYTYTHTHTHTNTHTHTHTPGRAGKKYSQTNGNKWNLVDRVKYT